MRRFLAVLAVLLVLLVVGAVAADRIVHARTEEDLETQLVQNGQLEGEADLTIHGVPFLTQLMAGELEHLSLQADGVRHEELSLTDVTADARGVGTEPPHEADRVTATVTVPLAVIQERIDAAGLGPAARVSAEGELLRLTTELLGTELALGARPRAVDGGVTLSVEEVELAGRTVELADVGLQDAGDIAVPLDGLPEQLRVSAVNVGDDGVRAELVGRDVPLEALAG